MFVFQQTLNAQTEQQQVQGRFSKIASANKKIEDHIDDQRAVAAYNKATNKNLTDVNSPQEIMSNLLTAQKELTKTIAISRDVVVVKDAKERLAAIKNFFKVCQISDQELLSYRAYLEFQQSEQLTDRLNKTKAEVSQSNFVISTASKQAKSAAEGSESDLADMRDQLRDRLRFVPRRNTG